MNRKFEITSHEILPEIKIIENFYSEDHRGFFTKLYNEEVYRELGIQTEVKEMFYSMSHKDVIRGMHYQAEPYAQAKLVHVVSGSIVDVVVDIRKDSKTFGKVAEIPIKAEDRKQVYIPVGFAHGFKICEDNTVLMFAASCGYNKDVDFGIRWDSIDYDWKLDNPIMSERDQSFIALSEL